jgi:hypothetical protein
MTTGPERTSYVQPVGWGNASPVEKTAFDTPCVRHHPHGGSVIRFLHKKGHGIDCVPGIWDTHDGKLLRFFPEADDLWWTPDGRHLLGVSDLRLSLLAWPSLSPVAECKLPYPSSGVGGMELAVSPDSTWAALWLYSGQSEEGYELFALPGLNRIGGLLYEAGTGGSPCVFSPDGKWLALMVEPDPLWWSTRDDRDWDTPAEGGEVHWATLFLHRQGAKAPKLHPVLVDLPAGYCFDEKLQGSTYPEHVHFVDDGRLCFDLPWGGTTAVALPPAKSILVDPPGR